MVSTCTVIVVTQAISDNNIVTRNLGLKKTDTNNTHIRIKT